MGRPFGHPRRPVPGPVSVSNGHSQSGQPESGPPKSGQPKSGQPKSWQRRWAEWVVIVAVAAGLAFGVVKPYVVQAFYIPSGSMIPTLLIGDRILVDKVSYDIHAIHRSDIVVFAKPPADTGDPQVQDLVKRVVGLPGDTISSAPDGQVLIDGKPLAEPYLTPFHRQGPGAGPPIAPQVVPSGDYFMMGDNRNDSKDSRYFGPVPGSLALGRVVLRIWPLDDLSVF